MESEKWVDGDIFVKFLKIVLKSFIHNKKLISAIAGNLKFCKKKILFLALLSTLLKQRFNVRMFTYYFLLKTGSYLNLKSKTPAALKSIVVNKFTCSRDVNTTYIGMSTRHLVTRVREHLQLNSSPAKSPISQTHFFLPKLSKL